MRCTSLLCIALLCVSGLAQALHLHTQEVVRGDTDKVRCSLCVVGHSPQEASAKIDVIPAQALDFEVTVRSARPLSRSAREASRIRPPPSL